jgi:methoxymalonate biosynthesis acyl carrier protein
MNQGNPTTKIKTFFARRFRGYELADEEEIFSLSFVNSLFATQLVLFVEKEFAVTIDDEDLEMENFRSVNSLVRLIERKGLPAVGL